MATGFYFCTFLSTLLPSVVWQQEEHPAHKNSVMRCWHGFLSGAKCKWLAYGSADATATPASAKSRMVILLVVAHPGSPRQGCKMVVVVVVVVTLILA